MIKLQFYLLLLAIGQLCISGITSYNLRYYSKSILLGVVLCNSTKMTPKQHIFVFPSVISPVILGPRFGLNRCRCLLKIILFLTPVAILLEGMESIYAILEAVILRNNHVKLF